jgi:hypothetical protein
LVCRSILHHLLLKVLQPARSTERNRGIAYTHCMGCSLVTGHDPVLARFCSGTSEGSSYVQTKPALPCALEEFGCLDSNRTRCLMKLNVSLTASRSKGVPSNGRGNTCVTFPLFFYQRFFYCTGDRMVKAYLAL